MWCCTATLHSEGTVGKVETILNYLKNASLFIKNSKPRLERDLLWGWKVWSWWVFKKKKIHNLCPYLTSQDMDNCINWRRKRNTEGICRVSGITGEVWGGQAPVLALPTAWWKAAGAHREASHAQGLQCPLQCPPSAGVHAQQMGCVLPLVCPAHASFSAVTLFSFCYQEGFLLTKNLRLALTKIQLDRNTCKTKQKYGKPYKVLCLLHIMFQNIKDSTGTRVHSTHSGVLGFRFFSRSFVIYFC